MKNKPKDKPNGVRKMEQEVFDTLRQIVVFSPEGHIDQVPVLFGGFGHLESYALSSGDKDGFYMQVPSEVEDMHLPVIGITTSEIGKDHVKMKGLILCGVRDELNQIAEQIYNTVTLNEKITVGNVKVSGRNVNKCGLLVGDFDIQFGG